MTAVTSAATLLLSMRLVLSSQEVSSEFTDQSCSTATVVALILIVARVRMRATTEELRSQTTKAGGMLLLLRLVRVQKHVHGHASESTFAFLPVHTAGCLCLSILWGRERVLMLGWRISWRRHCRGCFCGHFPGRDSGADLHEIVLPGVSVPLRDPAYGKVGWCPVRAGLRFGVGHCRSCVLRKLREPDAG